MEHIRTWTDPDDNGIRLELYDTFCTDSYDKQVLAYEFFHGETLVFEGQDFHCAPLHAIDSAVCVGGLLAFLSLQPGDTDPDYFDGYSDTQLAWCKKYGLQLSLYVEELENPVRYYRHTQSGDYLAIQPHRWHAHKDSDRAYEGRGTAVEGLLSSVCCCTICDSYLKEREPTRREDVPQEWRQAIGY